MEYRFHALWKQCPSNTMPPDVRVHHGAAAAFDYEKLKGKEEFEFIDVIGLQALIRTIITLSIPHITCRALPVKTQ